MDVKEIYYENLLTKMLFHKSSIKKIPLSGTFELSPVCNFDCRMCYVRKSPEEVKCHNRKMVNLEQWKIIADQAEKAGMLYLLLTGGEPFLWSDFWELYNYLSKKGFLISINSNGSLINEDVVERLKERPPIRINITLYGASNATYAKLCKAQKGFDKVDKAINLLREAGISVKLNGSLTPYNVGDLEAMIRYAEEKQLILETNPYMFPPIRKNPEKIGENDRFTARETAYWQIKRYQLQYGDELYKKHLQEICNGMVKPQGMDESCYDPIDGKVRCRAGKATFWITWDGYMLPCGMMPEPKVDMYNIPFEDAWKRLTQKTESIRLSGICEQCSNRGMCHSCAAMAYAETGTFQKVPIYLCEMMAAMKQIAEKELNNLELQ